MMIRPMMGQLPAPAGLSQLAATFCLAAVAHACKFHSLHRLAIWLVSRAGRLGSRRVGWQQSLPGVTTSEANTSEHS